MSELRIWELEKGVGACDDWGIVVWHGEVGWDETVYRYGLPMPTVSFPSSRLMVAGHVRRGLSWVRADWIRVPRLCITDPDVDWREWGDQINERAAHLTSTLDAEEPEDIVIPPQPTLRQIRCVLEPDFWFVRPHVKLVWVPGRKVVARPSAAAGFYGHHALPYPYVCIDDRALEALLAASDLEMVNAMPIDLAPEV